MYYTQRQNDDSNKRVYFIDKDAMLIYYTIKRDATLFAWINKNECISTAGYGH